MRVVVENTLLDSQNHESIPLHSRGPLPRDTQVTFEDIQENSVLYENFRLLSAALLRNLQTFPLTFWQRCPKRT